MNEEIKRAFEECSRFIDESTPEELEEYERSLNLNISDYKDDILYSEFVKRTVVFDEELFVLAA